VTPPAEGGPAAGRPEPSPRPKFTSRAAVLAVLICAIALTLAYPIREYIAERRQIAQLEAENAQLAIKLHKLKAEQRALTSSVYIEQQARDQLHWCFPTQTCYVVVNPVPAGGTAAHGRVAMPWYGLLWRSVGEANKAPAR
jgi:cell division protein FtsB